jgi:uncharacterized membrane protein YdcZ (DUF606 family)
MHVLPELFWPDLGTQASLQVGVLALLSLVLLLSLKSDCADTAGGLCVANVPKVPRWKLIGGYLQQQEIR